MDRSEILVVNMMEKITIFCVSQFRKYEQKELWNVVDGSTQKTLIWWSWWVGQITYQEYPGQLDS